MALPVHYSTADRFKFPITSSLIPYFDARDGWWWWWLLLGRRGVFKSTDSWA